MDCFADFCLHCDRDSPDGPYCSQQCKLADLEPSTPSSPTCPTSSSAERNWTSRQYYQRKTPSYSTPSTSGRPQSGYFMWTPPQQADDRSLTPSSSRTSLSSTSSTSTASGNYSQHTKAQLNDYFSSFDQAKAAKRRSSLR
ncbi:uncharacterized protein MYCFIDRAFT_210970 [Pseudocercospora fijiensis CIRAD86]|uniref:Uncharacterized protein n=1 Tax=Pseudocercospora fijiensis (strain CIRAD86) TaxID=383855 RepID=M3AJM9_PSEFD|nr:uncharacterized protein MYCFIDRAFT_210970 [Pseudocercospora fijiensis CIRAD86]EME84756.1 hypothetical protein MYCFIDRAFT_210970 [Pseudocercospora fijiensis CIRAD86]